jgi:HAD superfamily hydrolase (TIGR01509 family)
VKLINAHHVSHFYRKTHMTNCGFLWDLDGVLVDTGEFHYTSWAEILPQYGIPMTREQFNATFGMNNTGVLTTLLGTVPTPEFVDEVGGKKEEAFRAAVHGHGKLLPGVRHWLETLHQKGVRQAIGSSAPIENVDALVDETGIRPYFQAIVSALGKPSKPDPWVFLTAAEKIGVGPHHCTVVEDAVAGVEAARRAGMRCIAVTTTNPAEKLTAATLVIDRLDHLSPEDWLSRR